MSEPKPKFSDFDYTPAIERRGPAPISNMPVNALSGDKDPTRELRALIEQLQLNAREGTNRANIAEAERDRIAEQLDQFRRQNEELRSHFVEITSIIRERDSALADVERLGRAANEAQARIATVQRELTEMQRQREELLRARDEASRQRGDIQRQVDALTRASQESNRRFNDVQRQLFSIRQARDAAQAQNTELLQKIASLEERRNELTDQLDAAEKAVAEALSKAADTDQLAALREERDAAQQQTLETAAELQQLRAKVIDLTEQKAAALEAGNAHATALVEAREQIAQITHERDQMQTELLAKDHLIEEIRKNPDEATAAELEQAKQEIAGFKAEREAIEMRNQLLAREVMEMRQQLQSRAEQIGTLQRSLDETTGRMTDAKAQFEQLTQERVSAVTARDEALSSLSTAQKQIERIIRERDLIRQQSSERAVAMEAQIEALLAHLSLYEGSDPDAAARTGEFRGLSDRLAQSEEERLELAERLDKQRSETIDLGAQLQAAQEQIRELSASLAEARLQALSGGRSMQKRSAANTNPTSVTSRAVTTTEIFDAGAAISSMRQDYQAFLKSPTELRLLSDIAGHAQLYAELARTCGLTATHRIGAAFAGFAQELYHIPEQVNPSILRTVQQGIEFLATLPKLGNLAQAKDPASAIVYAVDDDPDNCECIRLAMETAMINTVCLQDPAKALVELGSTPCDLIFLDVSMPGMDGFQVCTEIRSMALHMNTPVIFLSGLTSAENRVQSNMSGGNEFVGKPFLLGELTLKALMLMMKAQLHLA